jgi:hypothetical protein
MASIFSVRIKENGKIVIVIKPQYKIVGINPKSGSHPSYSTPPFEDKNPISTMSMQHNDVMAKRMDIYTDKSILSCFFHKKYESQAKYMKGKKCTEYWMG